MQQQFKYPLAFRGEEEQQMELAGKLVELGYKWVGTEPLREGDEYPILHTKYDMENPALMGFFNEAGDRTLLDLRKISIECAVSIAAVRDGGEFDVFELAIVERTISGTLAKGVIFNPFAINSEFVEQCLNAGHIRRPTIPEIIAHFHPEQAGKTEQLPAWNPKIGDKVNIIYATTPDNKVFEIAGGSKCTYPAKYLLSGITDRSFTAYELSPYTEPATAEPETPFVIPSNPVATDAITYCKAIADVLLSQKSQISDLQTKNDHQAEDIDRLTTENLELKKQLKPQQELQALIAGTLKLIETYNNPPTSTVCH
jgi:hypothetical protein